MLSFLSSLESIISNGGTLSQTVWLLAWNEAAVEMMVASLGGVTCSTFSFRFIAISARFMTVLRDLLLYAREQAISKDLNRFFAAYDTEFNTQERS